VCGWKTRTVAPDYLHILLLLKICRISIPLLFMLSIVTQSITRRNKMDNNVHPGFVLVLTLSGSVSPAPWITLHTVPLYWHMMLIGFSDSIALTCCQVNLWIYSPSINKRGVVHIVLCVMQGPVVTDNSNFLVDWKFDTTKTWNWPDVSTRLKLIPGDVLY